MQLCFSLEQSGFSFQVVTRLSNKHVSSIIDLALLRLDRALHMTNKIKKIRINYDHRLDPHHGYSITISGWGKTEIEDHPDHLKKAELTLTGYSRDGGIMKLTSSDGKKSACTGDSGGRMLIF